MSNKNHEFGSLVCIYAQLLPRIREAAKGLGYALAIHGSTASCVKPKVKSYSLVRFK